LTNILLTLTSLFGLGASAVALEQREVVVTVPFDFVAGGKTLPAGTYTVRVSSDRLGALSISSYGYPATGSLCLSRSNSSSHPAH
jgi:hypothetical protein